MIYFDYAANTPVDSAVMETFVEENAKYIANPNSTHLMGRQAKARMDEITEHLGKQLGVQANEIIYTSGASEANNLAIKGIVGAYKQNGKHIISTCLEHSSVSGTLTYLQTLGYEIDMVDITPDGLVDVGHLRELLRKDTVLVSIGYVDSEMGVLQPIREIGQVLCQYPNCHFHCDGTQAVGKIPVQLDHIDCFTFTPHKFFGLNGCGVLVKAEGVQLEPLIHGGASTTIYRSGSPSVPLAASIDKALSCSIAKQEEQYRYVRELNEGLRNGLSGFKKVRINSSKYSLPHILNVSVQGVKAALFQEALEEEGICVSIKSACSVQNTPSIPVYTVTRDRKNAMCSWRISLSHWTTKEEIKLFLEAFSRCYEKLTN